MSHEQNGGIPAVAQDKITIPKLHKMKERKEVISALSIYNAPLARLFDRAGGEVIIVGDSAAITQEGWPNTKGMTMDRMVDYCVRVRNGTRRCFVVCDMPLGSYEVSDEVAVANALRFMQEADGNAVKVETNRAYLKRIEALTPFCPVVLHAGLNPNKADMLGGYKTFGKTRESVKELCEVVREGDKMGVCMILLESVTEEVSQAIREMVKAPVIGIAAGRNLDGQLLISDDLLGLYEWPGNVNAKHFVTYKADKPGFTVSDLTLAAFTWYVHAVKNGEFPGEENVHHLPGESREEIIKYLKKNVSGDLVPNPVLSQT